MEILQIAQILSNWRVAVSWERGRETGGGGGGFWREKRCRGEGEFGHERDVSPPPPKLTTKSLIFGTRKRRETSIFWREVADFVGGGGAQQESLTHKNIICHLIV